MATDECGVSDWGPVPGSADFESGEPRNRLERCRFRNLRYSGFGNPRCDFDTRHEWPVTFCSFLLEQNGHLGRLIDMAAIGTATKEAPADGASGTLSAVEVETINLFVQFSRALGQPRSVAEIYGLLFMSPRPLPMDDLVARLHLSKGSASQGLKYLLDLGAVRTVYAAGDRRTHYEAVTELRQLAGRFLRRQVAVHFEDSAARLDRITAEARKLSGAERKHANERVEVLGRWAQRGRRALPLILKLLGE